MPVSQNGYSANDRSKIRTYDIDGELVPLRKGATGALLVEVALFVDRNVEPIDKGHPQDDWGYAERTIRGYSETLSNHASGTALDFNATQHPLGVEGTWTRREKRKLNRFLRRECEHVIRWGENYDGRVDGMHFEINDDFREVRAVLVKIRRGDGDKRVRRTPTVNLANVAEQFRTGGTTSLYGVKVVQRELRRRGYEITIDGWAGPSTRDAYRHFERSINSPRPDGIPGWLSLRVLGGVLPLPQRRRFRVRRS